MAGQSEKSRPLEIEVYEPISGDIIKIFNTLWEAELYCQEINDIYLINYQKLEEDTASLESEVFYTIALVKNGSDLKIMGIKADDKENAEMLLWSNYEGSWDKYSGVYTKEELEIVMDSLVKASSDQKDSVFYGQRSIIEPVASDELWVKLPKEGEVVMGNEDVSAAGLWDYYAYDEVLVILKNAEIILDKNYVANKTDNQVATEEEVKRPALVRFWRWSDSTVELVNSFVYKAIDAGFTIDEIKQRMMEEGHGVDHWQEWMNVSTKLIESTLTLNASTHTLSFHDPLPFEEMTHITFPNGYRVLMNHESGCYELWCKERMLKEHYLPWDEMPNYGWVEAADRKKPMRLSGADIMAHRDELIGQSVNVEENPETHGFQGTITKISHSPIDGVLISVIDQDDAMWDIEPQYIDAGSLYVDDGSLFLGVNLFLNFTDDETIVYTPENWDDDEKEGYTAKDILELCEGDEALAYRVFAQCEWQHPETILSEIEIMDGDEDEPAKVMSYVNARYSLVVKKDDGSSSTLEDYNTADALIMAFEHIKDHGYHVPENDPGERVYFSGETVISMDIATYGEDGQPNGFIPVPHIPFMLTVLDEKQLEPEDFEPSFIIMPLPKNIAVNATERSVEGVDQTIEYEL